MITKEQALTGRLFKLTGDNLAIQYWRKTVNVRHGSEILTAFSYLSNTDYIVMDI